MDQRGIDEHYILGFACMVWPNGDDTAPASPWRISSQGEGQRKSTEQSKEGIGFYFRQVGISRYIRLGLLDL